jgi:ABC-2 type transport system permease protein
MKRLLQIEFYKFYKNPLTLVILLLFSLLMPFLSLSAKEILKDAVPPFPSAKVFYEFPTVWDYQGYIGNWLVSLLLGFLMINFITTEEMNKTMRQSIINGLTRREYWMSKVMVVIMCSLYATILYTITCLVYGLTSTPDVDLELIVDSNWAPLKFFLMCMGYISMAALFALWIRRGFLSMFIYLAYIIVIEQIVRGIHLYFYEDRSVLFYPVNAIEDLMPNPLFTAGSKFLNKDLGFDIILLSHESVGISIGLTILFIWLCRKMILTKDV